VLAKELVLRRERESGRTGARGLTRPLKLASRADSIEPDSPLKRERSRVRGHRRRRCGYGKGATVVKAAE